jgi:hypothetical protein
MAKTSSPKAVTPVGRRVRFIILCASIGAVIVATTLGISSLIHQGHGMLGISSTVSLGIIGSLGATAFVGLLAVIWRLADSNSVPLPRPIEAARNDGLATTSRRKCDLEFEEWFAFLERAQKEFYVVGHTMGKWCDPSRRGAFVSEIQRLLAAKGRVTLVMLGPKSPQVPILRGATGKDYSSRIADTDAVLTELESSLAPAHKRRLRVSRLEDDSAIPYMVVGNEERLVTATYLARTDSNDMPCIELVREDEAARAIYDDLHKLAAEGAAQSVADAAPKFSGGLAARLASRPRRSP